MSQRLTHSKMISAVVVVLATGCAAAQQQQDSITDVVRKYNEDVRWGRYDTAAVRIPARMRSERVDEWDQRSKDLKLTEYEIVRIDAHGKDAARAQIKMSWYLDSEQIVRETSAVQHWERKGKNWLIVDEERLRGAEMPGLPEPSAHTGSDAK